MARLPYRLLKQRFYALVSEEWGHLPRNLRQDKALSLLSKLIGRFHQEGRHNHERAAIQLFEDYPN